MKKGDYVVVHPHGFPHMKAVAQVAIISDNKRAIAVGFDERPPFHTQIKDPLAIAIHPEYGIMLFAHREAIDGIPVGPWIEMVGGGHYEIEETGSIKPPDGQ